MSIKDLTCQKIYPLSVGKETIIGRGRFGIVSGYVSSKQVIVDYTQDERCFIKKATKKVVYLNGSGLMIDKEYEVENMDIIEFGLEGYKQGERARFQFILPERKEKLVRSIVRLKEESTIKETDSSSSSSDNDNDIEDDDTRFDSHDDEYNVYQLSDESDYVH